MTYRRLCAMKMPVRPVGCCCVGAHTLTHINKPLLRGLSQPQASWLLVASWGCDLLAQPLEHHSNRGETSEVRQKARERPSQRMDLALAECWAPCPLRQNQGTQCNTHHCSKQPFLINKKPIFGSIQKVKVPIKLF